MAQISDFVGGGKSNDDMKTEKNIKRINSFWFLNDLAFSWFSFAWFHFLMVSFCMVSLQVGFALHGFASDRFRFASLILVSLQSETSETKGSVSLFRFKKFRFSFA